MEAFKTAAAMVLVQILYAGVNIFYKLALNDRMDIRIMVTYRYLFAAASLIPIAYLVERFCSRVFDFVYFFLFVLMIFMVELKLVKLMFRINLILQET